MNGSLWGAVAALLYFALFQLCGISCVLALVPQEGRGVRLLLGSVCGSVLLQWCPVLFAFFWVYPASSFLRRGAGLPLGVAGFWQYKRHGARSPGGGESLLSLLRRRKFRCGVSWQYWDFTVFWFGNPSFLREARLQQSGHLRGYEHAPEFSHQPEGAGNLPAGLLASAGDKAILSFPFRQHFFQSLSAGRAAEVCLCIAHVRLGPRCCLAAACFSCGCWGTAAAGRRLPLYFSFSTVAWASFIFLGGEPENFTRLFTAFLRNAHKSGWGRDPLGQCDRGHDAAPARHAVRLGRVVSFAVPAVPGCVRG